MRQPNRNTTALQPLSSAVLRKKPKGPKDGEPSNQPNRNTTALQPLFPAVIRKKPKGSAIRTPRTMSDVVRHKMWKTSEGKKAENLGKEKRPQVQGCSGSGYKVAL
ncbi:hypothetical protein ACFX13_005438 [Malus domestica]